jgi:hypothetical protein
MLQKAKIEILVEGLSQKFDEKVQPDAKLSRADNVEVDKAAQLNKRRGYRFVDVSGNEIGGTANDSLFTKMAVRADELVLFSNHVYAVSDPYANTIGTSLVRRGPVLRGAYRLRVIVAGPGRSQE